MYNSPKIRKILSFGFNGFGGRVFIFLDRQLKTLYIKGINL